MRKAIRAVSSVREWLRRTYGDAVSRQRHVVEEDARRLNGKVVWND